MNSLDNILSGREEPVPEAGKQEQTAATQETTEQVAGGAEQADPEAETTEGEQAGGQKTVPHAALHAEKVKVKRYTEEVSGFREEIGGLKNANAQLVQQLQQLTATLQRPKQEPAPPPDFYENPDAAVDHRISKAVSPEFDRLNGVLMHNSRLIASQLHTEDAVTAADKAFTEAYESRKLEPADYQRVISSPNIYDAAVKWHKRQQALAEIGDDPTSYRAKIEAEIMAKLGAQPDVQQTQQQAQPAAVMPSNLATARSVGARSGPTWAGPKPLNDIFKR